MIFIDQILAGQVLPKPLPGKRKSVSDIILAAARSSKLKHKSTRLPIKL